MCELTGRGSDLTNRELGRGKLEVRTALHGVGWEDEDGWRGRMVVEIVGRNADLAGSGRDLAQCGGKGEGGRSATGAMWAKAEEKGGGERGGSRRRRRRRLVAKERGRGGGGIRRRRRRRRARLALQKEATRVAAGEEGGGARGRRRKSLAAHAEEREDKEKKKNQKEEKEVGPAFERWIERHAVLAA